MARSNLAYAYIAMCQYRDLFWLKMCGIKYIDDAHGNKNTAVLQKTNNKHILLCIWFGPPDPYP